jgi:hypothetical protein
MAAKPKLYYFNGRGRMESIRWLLAAAGVEVSSGLGGWSISPIPSSFPSFPPVFLDKKGGITVTRCPGRGELRAWDTLKFLEMMITIGED